MRLCEGVADLRVTANVRVGNIMLIEHTHHRVDEQCCILMDMVTC